MTRSMTLAQWLHGVASAGPHGDLTMTGLNLDSRAIAPGEVFVALAGHQAHGIDYARQAQAQGAVAVVAEAPEREVSGVDIPVIWIADLRLHLGALAARFFADPSRALTVVGVTGTNGKTSTVQLLGHAWTALGYRAATIGTLGAGPVGELVAGARTTPDVISVQRDLAVLRDAGVTHVAMEVSSHALDQHRVDGVAFDIAVFTNLTRDHLDYHGTMEAYGEAKARLFAWPTLKSVALNIDDPFGRELATRIAPNVQQLLMGVHVVDADVHASGVKTRPNGLFFHLYTPWGKTGIESDLLGRFNVANLLAVVACMGALGEPFARMVNVLEHLAPVPGRMNRLGGADGQPLVVVDYAHTPDALEKVLTSLREHCAGQLVCVFGCGGERDHGKRPLMGAIAGRLADIVIVTDDNPRGEDGDAIVAAIVAGIPLRTPSRVVRDRRSAIELAIHHAAANDVVLIAGKGHETWQEGAAGRVPFDDREVAREVLGVAA